MLAPDLVMYYSRDAQRDCIECLRLRSHEQKCKFLKGVQMTFFKTWRNTNHVKCRYRITGKLLFIEVLWELFHPNTPIKDELSRLCSFLHISSFLVIFPRYPSLPSSLCSIYGLDNLLPISYLEVWIVFHQVSTIKPVTLANLMVSFRHWAEMVHPMTYWIVDTISLLCHLIIAG